MMTPQPAFPKRRFRLSNLALLAALILVFSCASRSTTTPAAPPATEHDNPPVTNDSATKAVTVALHPGPTVEQNKKTQVSFGFPLPKGLVVDPARIRVVDAKGQEVPAHVEVTTWWRSLLDPTANKSVRSALISLEVAFPDAEPMNIRLEYDAPRARTYKPLRDVRSSWIDIARGVDALEYPPEENIKEPPVYATFPAEWLSRAVLGTPTYPLFSKSSIRWFDDAFLNFAYTAVNDVGEHVTPSNRIDYVKDYEPWLYDRAMTLFILYIRTGELKWLRHAHRAAQFYGNHIRADGSFDLKSQGDMKYSFAQSLLVDFMLTGDPALLPTIEAIANFTAEWPESYSEKVNFWTERHQAYSLLGALTAWEATGKPEYARRVRTIARASFRHLRTPPNGWSADGCLPHTFRSHEGSGDDAPVCSPWMSALLAEAMARYYVHSNDKEALVFLASLGDFVGNHGVYRGEQGELEGLLLPWYLASSLKKWSPNPQWGDVHHACDVAGLVAKGAWAQRLLRRDPTDLIDTANDLLQTCQYNLESMHREGADTKHGKAVWRLSPPRQFNWWFVTNAGLPWYLKPQETK